MDGAFAIINETCAISGDLSKEGWSAELEPSSDHLGDSCYFLPVTESPKEQGLPDFQWNTEFNLWITHMHARTHTDTNKNKKTQFWLISCF